MGNNKESVENKPKKKRVNSKAKGKRGELEWARLCRANGYEVRRTAQFCGNNEAGAADCVGLPGIHQEVKRYEKQQRVQDWMDQSIRDTKRTGQDAIPIVAHRIDNCDWLVTMRAEDFFKLYREYDASMELSKREKDHEV